MSSVTSLLSDLNTELKIDPNDKIWSQAVKIKYINQAYLKIQQDGQFNWKENQGGTSTGTTTAGTAEYALPTDFARMTLVIFNDDPLTTSISFEEAQRRNPTAVQGTPSDYYISGGNIGFDPVPNSATSYKLVYRKKLARLTSSDSITFSDDFDDAITKYAAYLAWSSPRGNAQEARNKLFDYNEIMNSLKASYLVVDMADLNFGISRTGKRITRANVLL